MSVHLVQATGRYVIRFRDADGRNCSVTLNKTNLHKYGQHIPDRFTERVAKKLEQAILARETGPDGSVGSIGRRRLLWLDVVARYLPPLLNRQRQDIWEARPTSQRLENEKTYSRNQLDRMHRILTVYFPQYLDRGKINWRRNGKRRHNRTARVYTCTRRIQNITREDVAGFQICLRRANLGPASVRGYMVALKTFLAWCAARGYLLTNPALEVKLPPRKKREVRWLEQDKAKGLLKAVEGHPLEGPVRAILRLGLRREEMINLEGIDINFDEAIVRIRGSKTSSSFREVPLPKALAAYFRTLQWSDQIPSVLRNTHGEPWNKHSLNSSLRRFHAASHLPFDWNFQMLRATYGSLLVQQGIPIAHVSMALGHTDVRVTQGWYIGLRSTDVAPQISEAIDQALS